MCRLLGIDCQWKQRLQTDATWCVIPQYQTLDDDDKKALQRILKNRNTHGSFISLIDGENDIIITARDISRDEQKYADFVQHHFAANGKRIEDEAIAHTYQTFDGNTYYNQKAMREAFAVTAVETVCTKDMIEQIIHSMVRDTDRHYSEILARLSLPQKELLYAIAKDHRAMQITSGMFIRRHSLKSSSSVQNSIRKLLEYGIVSFDSGTYYIADQLMRLWLIG